MLSIGSRTAIASDKECAVVFVTLAKYFIRTNDIPTTGLKLGITNDEFIDKSMKFLFH